jgi:ribosomal protein L40E
MTCSQCQAQNPDDARFCEECGARLALACPQCGAEISPGKKFCRACGTALSGRVPDRPRSPASYTPKHLAEEILTSKAVLEGDVSRTELPLILRDAPDLGVPLLDTTKIHVERAVEGILSA